MASIAGTAVVLYLDLAKLPADALSARNRLIMTYALCGFANFGSLGIEYWGPRDHGPGAPGRSPRP